MGGTILAFDTSTEVSALALLSRGGHSSCVRPGGAAASDRLIGDLLALLDQEGLAIADVDTIAVGIGPGAFTGLRTACAVAQGLAFGRERPVLPLDSLMLVAEDAIAQVAVDDGPLWVAMDARMREVYAAAYELVGGDWRVVDAPALYTLEALAARWRASAPVAVAGSALDAFGEDLPCGPARRIARQRDRGAALAALVRRRSDHVAPTLGAAQVLPLYLRDKVALTTRERERGAVQRTPSVR